jgi:hypothetical protein
VSLIVLLLIRITLLGFCPGVIVSCLGYSVSFTCTYENLKFSECMRSIAFMLPCIGRLTLAYIRGGHQCSSN